MNVRLQDVGKAGIGQRVSERLSGLVESQFERGLPRRQDGSGFTCTEAAHLLEARAWRNTPARGQELTTATARKRSALLCRPIDVDSWNPPSKQIFWMWGRSRSIDELASLSRKLRFGAPASASYTPQAVDTMNLRPECLAFAPHWCRLSGAQDPLETASCGRGVSMKRRELLRAGVLTGAAAALRPALASAQGAQNAANSVRTDAGAKGR